MLAVVGEVVVEVFPNGDDEVSVCRHVIFVGLSDNVLICRLFVEVSSSQCEHRDSVEVAFWSDPEFS